MVLHAVADEALALDRERVELEVRRDRVAEEERSGEVLDRARRQQQRPLSVDRQLQLRQVTGVVDEEAVRRLADVAELAADAEGRPFEDRLLRHYDGSRKMRPPDAWLRALTTISS